MFHSHSPVRTDKLITNTPLQALRTSLGCDREEAVALMRQSGGNVSTALRSAVQATRLDEPAVQQLAQQYAIFRCGWVASVCSFCRVCVYR